MLRESIPRVSPKANGPASVGSASEAYHQAKEVPMAQLHSALSDLQPSVEHVAGAINSMIAERAQERLGKIPAVGPLPEAPKTPTPLKPRAPGVYFGLSSDEYHADPSLGSTDLKRL